MYSVINLERKSLVNVRDDRPSTFTFSVNAAWDPFQALERFDRCIFSKQKAFQ